LLGQACCSGGGAQLRAWRGQVVVRLSVLVSCCAMLTLSLILLVAFLIKLLSAVK